MSESERIKFEKVNNVQIRTSYVDVALIPIEYCLPDLDQSEIWPLGALSSISISNTREFLAVICDSARQISSWNHRYQNSRSLTIHHDSLKVWLAENYVSWTFKIATVRCSVDDLLVASGLVSLVRNSSLIAQVATCVAILIGCLLNTPVILGLVPEPYYAVPDQFIVKIVAATD